MKNFKSQGRDMSVTVTDPPTPVAGDPVLWGEVPGVAVTDEREDGKTTVRFYGVYELSVQAVDTAGASDVNDADKIYYTAGDTPPLSKKDTGVFFGQAYDGTITAGATSIVQVRLGRV